MKKNGFTLIEILVVIAIMAITGIILTEVFIRSLRGGNKAEVLSLLKQNGQSVLERMDKDIRNSDSVVCVDSTKTMIVIQKNGVYTRFRLKDKRMLEDRFSLPEDAVQATFLTAICANDNFEDFAPTILTDSEKVEVVEPENLKVFTSDTLSGYKAVVTVSFLLQPSIPGIPKNVADQIDPVSFVTTIQVR